MAALLVWILVAPCVKVMVVFVEVMVAPVKMMLSNSQLAAKGDRWVPSMISITDPCRCQE